MLLLTSRHHGGLTSESLRLDDRLRNPAIMVIIFVSGPLVAATASGVLTLPSTASLLRKHRAEHRQTADGRGFARLILQRIPVFCENAVCDAHDVRRDPRGGPAVAENRQYTMMKLFLP